MSNNLEYPEAPRGTDVPWRWAGPKELLGLLLLIGLPLLVALIRGGRPEAGRGPADVPGQASPEPSRSPSPSPSPSANIAATGPFLRSEGVLYVRWEQRQAQHGLSLVRGGGEFRDLTTVYERWLDVRNPWRFRQVSRELLEEGPELLYASGSDGVSGWWKMQAGQAEGAVVRHEGRAPLLAGAPPGKTELTIEDFLRALLNDRVLVDASRRGEAEILGSEISPPWGLVMHLRSHDPRSFKTTTATLSAETPHILIRKTVEDARGALYASLQLTDWRWLDADELGEGFWMTEPEGTEHGLGAEDPID